MADPVLRPVDSGLGPNLQRLKQTQRIGDGQSDPGAGPRAARAMTGMQDASSAGGLQMDTPAKFAGFPEPLRGLLNRNLAGDPDPQVR